MENLYPKFERNRILKKEQLLAMRDRCYGYIETEYQEYGEGILMGCEVRVEDQELVVGPGMLKFGRFICLLAEEERIGYGPKEGVQYLKLRGKGDRDSPDGVVYKMALVLEMEENRDGRKNRGEEKTREKRRKARGEEENRMGVRAKNEGRSEWDEGEYDYELCRFHLRDGARLRQEYTDFYDMETEYDTVNVIHGSWSGLGGKGISPCVTRRFAEELLSKERLDGEDYGFAYQCLCQRGAMPMKAVEAYIRRRTGEEIAGRERAYGMLCRILEEAGGKRRRSGGNGKGRRQILVD